MAIDTYRLIHEAIERQETTDLGPALSRWFGAGPRVTIAIGGNAQQPVKTVIWAVARSREMRLTVSAAACTLDQIAFVAHRLARLLPLILAYGKGGSSFGEVAIELEDYSDDPGLVFGSRWDEAFLIPDTDFIGSRGYAAFRKAIRRALPPWRDREPRALWRGSTTGLVWLAPDWRDLPRLKLCAVAQQRPDLFDVGVARIVQIDHLATEIEASGVMRPPVPAERWGNYRYQIDIDGNANAWAGYFQRLLTGSPVLKIASPLGLRQWYYRDLQPWIHFVPVERDMSDLIAKAEWLARNPILAEGIGAYARALASAMTYKREMQGAVRTVDGAMQGSPPVSTSHP